MTAYLTDMYILPKPTCTADKQPMWLGDPIRDARCTGG